MKKIIHPTEILDITIEYLDESGRGVARYTHPPLEGSNGKRLTLYIGNVVPGDVVRVTVPNAKGRGKAVVDYDELLSPGPTRNLDVPTHEAVSGGTPLQYMHYKDQLTYKMDMIKGYLEKKTSIQTLSNLLSVWRIQNATVTKWN